MEIYKDVYSTVNPIEVDLESSPSTVYVRSNIRKEYFERFDREMYIYDEIQYTNNEYSYIKAKEVDMLKQQNAVLLLNNAKNQIAINELKEQLNNQVTNP